jgi:precorrin-6B C5,15-methyltransferase / cobalt-precorrin-6B C5,C15-methyltransferase
MDGFMLSANPIDPHFASVNRWLSIVGIGEDGIDGLSASARDLIQSATVVFGGKRHLALAAPLIRGTTQAWPHPFEQSLGEVLALRGQAVCVLASGDPLCYGVGSLVAAHVFPDEIRVIPSVSAFSLAASRLLWTLPQTELISLCGRSIDSVRAYLQPGARILALSGDQHTPAQLANLLAAIGYGASRLTVLESLGGAGERIRSTRADDFAINGIGPLNVVAIEVVAGTTARIVPKSHGLEDALFEHDGQITKREMRALALSALAPQFGQRLWDIGAGSGSVAIEWLLSHASLDAIAIERRPERLERVKRNAANFGVPHLECVLGEAPHVLEGLAAPDAVFIGGGATTSGLIATVQSALRPTGRLVVHAVTVSTESALANYQSTYGGSLTRVAISRASPIGKKPNMLGWRTAMPVTQWVWVKT